MIVLPHISSFQYFAGSVVSDLLAKKLNTQVSVGRVQLGLPNVAIIDDILIYDRQHKKMLQSDRLTADVEVWTFVKDNKIRVNSVAFYGLDADIYKLAAKEGEQEKYNYQFVIDAFASEDTTHTPLDLKINDVVIHRANLHFDDLQHDVIAEDLNARIAINALTDDNLHARVSKLAANIRMGSSDKVQDESNAQRHDRMMALSIKNLSSNIGVSFAGKSYSLSAFNLKLPQTNINIDTARYDAVSKQYMANIRQSVVATSDFRSILPILKKADRKIILTANVKGNAQELNIGHLDLLTPDNSVRLTANAHLQKQNGNWNADANISKFAIQSGGVAAINEIVKLPVMVSRLGNVGYIGNLKLGDRAISAKGNITSSLGSVAVDGVYAKNNIEGTLKTNGFDLAKLLASNSLGTVAGDVAVNNNSLNGKISRFDYLGYAFKDVDVDVKADMTSITSAASNMDLRAVVNDANGQIVATGTWSKSAGLSAEIIADKVNPYAMHLIKSYPNTTFSTKLKIDVNGTDIDNFIGVVSAENFLMSSPNAELAIDKLDLSADMVDDSRKVTFASDFAKFDIAGDFRFADLLNDLTHAIRTRIPSVPWLPETEHTTKHKYTIDAELLNIAVFSQIVSLPIELVKPMALHGSVDNYTNTVDVRLSLPAFKYKEEEYDDCQLVLTTPNDTMTCNLSMKKPISPTQHYNVSVDVVAANDNLNTSVVWYKPKSGDFNGCINANTVFFRDNSNNPALHATIMPSELVFNDTIWTVAPARIEYANRQIVAKNLEIRHGNQFLNIDGTASSRSSDSIVVSLHDMNLEYILNAVDFNTVDFCGFASGKAVVKEAFGNPSAYAELNCRQFQFEHGDLGDMAIRAEWNKDEKQIDIKAYSSDKADGHVSVNGYLSPAKNYVDLNIIADKANIAFLEYFVDNVMDSTVGTCSGDLNLVGPLSSIQLVGAVSANAKCHVHVLGTDYDVRGDTIYFVPDDILFKDVKAYDKYNNIVLVNGALHHKSLTRMTFDMDFVSDKILAYDFDDFYGESFYGTVFAKGNVQMHGISGQVEINADVTPLKGSTYTYNAVVQNYLNTQKFITFRDKNRVEKQNENDDQDENETDELRSNLYCNFTVNVDENAQIRILMDSKTDDYITLYGNGTIKANYYNKGKFGLYGTYTVSRGNYSLTLQNILTKDFKFQEGGTVVFGGDPYDAVLNLQATYPVNNVSLSDLALGTSFTDNTIRVNCLMNITGQPKQPKVNFDLDMPTVNSDEKQMVRSIINSEEDMNQQVVYLLGIGRFYTRGVNNADQNASRSQTTLAMQSLLSGTISSQLNNMLSQVLKTNNWNFGANISTGTEGWQNAQYEGMVSGHMFNNRLLFNGQFGYRDNINTAQTNFIGDFDIQYMLTQNGNLSIKAYNQTNERYFTKSALNTQGLGLLIKKEFSSFSDLFRTKTKSKLK